MEKPYIGKTEGGYKKLTDIALVAYLQCKGFKMRNIKKMEGDRDKSAFWFYEGEDLEDEILRFFNHDALVDPLAFSEMLRNLRSYAKQS